MCPSSVDALPSVCDVTPAAQDRGADRAELADDGLLVRLPLSAQDSGLADALAVPGLEFSWERLFTDPEEGVVWLLGTPSQRLDVDSTWALAHRLTGCPLARSLPEGLYVEPNSASRERPPFVPQEGLPRGGSPGLPQDVFWPRGRDFAWHLGPDYTQLKAARERAGLGRGVRVAHLDTGYDPGHVTCPVNIDTQAARNLARRSRDARDNNGGLFQGHGSGTLSVLAGGRFRAPGFDDYLGGAPLAEIVPIVPTGSVWTDHQQGSWAAAVAHAVDVGCDVITMSAGGVGMGAAFHSALSRAYSHGVLVVAAAGNNAGGIPRADLLQPAAHPRVLGVSAAMADHQPYRYRAGRLYGGNSATGGQGGTAMAAFSPNTARARLGSRDIVDMTGDGTSASTPQVAAAAALWLQVHKASVSSKKHRAREAMHALMVSADKRAGWFGGGLVRALDALGVRPRGAAVTDRLDASPSALPPGGPRLPAMTRRMLEVEARQLARRGDGGDLQATASAWPEASPQLRAWLAAAHS